MNFNFDYLIKGHSGGMVSNLPVEGIRLRKSGITVTMDAARKLGPTVPLKSGTRMNLDIAYDNVQQAIKLVHNPTTGYSFFSREGTQPFQMNTSPYMRKFLSSLPMGDYLPVEGEVGVFVLAR